jgi:cyclic pyranopterin phosphate synthase
MPEESLGGKQNFLPRKELLNDHEIERLVRVFCNLGTNSVRLTGGEPLLRPGFVDLVRRISAIEAVHDLSMTTNAVHLPRLAPALADAGLNRITVSLDSLDEAVFTSMSGGRGRVSQVLDGIKAAESAGFKKLKINCVVKRGTNDHTVLDMVEHFRGSGHVLRLIEYLDVGSSNDWTKSLVVAGETWRQRIDERWPLETLPQRKAGETAQRFAYKDGAGEIGLINSITRPFCGHCSRARIAADGMLYTCLFASKGIALKPLLKEQRENSVVEKYIREIWTARDDRYSEIRHLKSTPKPAQEMYRMGG